jgi:hypothetical protein
MKVIKVLLCADEWSLQAGCRSEEILKLECSVGENVCCKTTLLWNFQAVELFWPRDVLYD